MSEPIQVISAAADFYPEEAPAGMIEWTFLAPKATEVGAGLYELRFVRPLTSEERQRLFGKEPADV